MANYSVHDFKADFFHFMSPPILVLSGNLQNEFYWNIPPHRHEDYSEIIYISEGECEFIINNRRYLGRQGDTVIFNKGIYHQEMSSKDQPLNTYYCAVGNLHIEGMEPGFLIPGHLDPIIPKNALSPQVHYLMNEIFRECKEQEIGYRSIVHNFLNSLVLILLRMIQEKYKLHFLTSTYTTANMIRDYLDENFIKDVSLADLSKKFFLSQHYISHIFKDEIGDSPINYMITRRMDEAKKLLLTSDQTIADIAGQVGYDNPNHFSMTFRRITNLTPGEYRKKIKGNIITF